MKIKWDSPFTGFTHGYRCDACGTEDDPEGHNSSWFSVQCMAADWDACSADCVAALDLNAKPLHEDPDYVGGRR